MGFCGDAVVGAAAELLCQVLEGTLRVLYSLTCIQRILRSTDQAPVFQFAMTCAGRLLSEELRSPVVIRRTDLQHIVFTILEIHCREIFGLVIPNAHEGGEGCTYPRMPLRVDR